MSDVHMDEIPPEGSSLDSGDASGATPVTDQRSKVRAAKLVLWSPFVGLFLLIGFLALESRLHGTPLRPGMVFGSFGISSLIWLVGVVVGVFLLVPSKPRKGIAGRAVVGMGFNLILIVALTCLAVWFVRTRAEMEKSRERGGGVETAQTDEARYAHIQLNLRTLERRARRLATNGQGEDSLLAVAVTNLLHRERIATERFYSAVKPVSTGYLLDMSDVQDEAELDRRKDIVQKSIIATLSFNRTYNHLEDDYRSDLVKSGASQSGMSNALFILHTNLASRLPWLERMGDARIEWGGNEIAALDLLKTNWDQWAYDEEKRKLVFEDTNTAAEFNRLVREINRLHQTMQSIQQQRPK
jgi:hypothetical protein